MARPELDSLLNWLFPAAQQLLEDQGSIYPIGAVVRKDGDVVAYAADAGKEHPETSEIIDLLLKGFREEANAGSVRAVGICLDTFVIKPGEIEKRDALCAQLEHEDGECVDVFLPYRKRFLGRYAYDQVFAGPGEARVFSADRR